MSQGVEKAKDAPGVRQGKKGPGGKLTTGSSYTTPGVYVRDIPSGVRLVREAETSIAAFLGCVAQASPPEGPVRVGNWGEFSRRFPPQAGNGSSAFLPEAVYGYFANGGGPCYVIHVPRDAAGAAYTAALLLLETVPEVTMVAAPDLRNTTAGATVAADPKQVYQEMAKHCTKMRNRMALVDPASDLPPDDPAKVQEWLGSLGLDDVDKQFAAVYYPWVTVPGLHGKPLAVPPSGHVAGVWGRSDARRGVHKAPANETLAYANALTVTLTAGEQGPLNEVGVNCLRSFPGRGLKVWGARTLSPETDWRYV
ncbi:phage tail sheath family protein, partial [Streptomyces yunnanensis]